MPTITLSYDGRNQAAVISPKEDCPANSWSNIRRFFEERQPDILKIRATSLSIPWWAFLSLREAFAFVLRVNGITNLDCSQYANELLSAARERSERFLHAEELRTVRSKDDVANALLNQGFKRILLPYQLRNVAQLCSLPAAATFSVPGAGKTSEALAYYFLNREPTDKLLVIAPKNAFVAWEDELPECVPEAEFSFVRLTGGYSRIHEILAGNPTAVIISYHQLPRVMDAITSYLVRNDVFMFIDESHRMKRGVAGVQGSSILNLSHLPKRKLILSGTPMPNAQDDLIAQFNYLYPEYSLKSDQVIEKLRHVFVRTTKSELGLIPPIRILRPIAMKAAQEQLYSSLADNTMRLLQGFSINDRVRFRRISACVQYMIQAASNPSLLIASSVGSHKLLREAIQEGISAKIEYTCALTRTWVDDGHKVVIWSTFVETVEHIADLLADVGAHFIHGGVITSEDPDTYDSREAKIREFNNPSSDCRVLVANPAACSEGISLHHVCHRAIYVNRNYNAAHYLQSEDRIHRIGLPHDLQTSIVILYSPSTIDESINRRLQEKVENMSSVLNDPDLSIKPLNLDFDQEQDCLDSDDIEDIRRMLGVVQ